LTGDLAEDLLGGWADGGLGRDVVHPALDLTPMGDGLRVWLFREDGTGIVWYGAGSRRGISRRCRSSHGQPRATASSSMTSPRLSVQSL
jgi:hypothetical protein